MPNDYTYTSTRPPTAPRSILVGLVKQLREKTAVEWDAEFGHNPKNLPNPFRNPPFPLWKMPKGTNRDAEEPGNK